MDNQPIERVILALKAILETSDAPDAPHITQYVDELRDILQGFESSGVSTAEICAEICGTLKAQEITGYIGLACELSAANHFRTNYPTHFKYRVINPSQTPNQGTPKSFDFSAVFDGFSFNVEVKTFSRKKGNDNPWPIKVFLPKDQMKGLYTEMQKVGLGFSSNCAPAIGRFLTDANSQLLRPENGLAVVILCCNDFDEYADAMECLIGQHGIVTKQTAADTSQIIPSPEELPNIDAIVVCVAGLSHYGIIDERKYCTAFRNDDLVVSNGKDVWNYAYALPVGIPLRDGLRSEDLANAFMRAFHSHHLALSELWEKSNGDLQTALFALFNNALKGNPADLR